MKHLWNKRRLAVLGAVAAVVGVTLWAVLPALAGSPGGTAGDPSQYGTVEYSTTGGQSNDCELFDAFSSGRATDQYLVKNPKSIDGKPQTVIAGDGSKVTFTVTLESSTVLDFKVSGALVTDVGIDGGSGTDHFSYPTQPDLGVTHDTKLHAPVQSNGTFFNLSQTTFCYVPKITCQEGAFGDPKIPDYTIELPSCTGKDGVIYDFGTGTTTYGGQTYFTLHTEGASATTPMTPMVENVTGTLGSASQTTLQYTDIFPFLEGNLHDMRFCQLDPRAGGSDPMALDSNYNFKSDPPSTTGSAAVLQPKTAPDGVDPESTSCLISWHTWVDSAGAYHYQAYVYSLVDGLRTIG